MTGKRASNPPVSDRWSYLWLAIATVLLVFTYGMYRNPLAACLALVFMIRFLRTQKTGKGYLWVVLALGVANTISWWRTSFELPAAFRIIFGFAVGVVYSVPFLCDRLLVRRFRSFAATLVFPFASASLEFLAILPNPMTTYGSLAYSQFSSVFLIQVMSITGMWGVVFLVAWSASMINWIWEESLAWTGIRRGVAIFVGVNLAVVLYGMVRLAAFHPQPGTVRIHGVIETDFILEEWYREVAPLIGSDPSAVRAYSEPSYDRYLNATVREARAGAQIVVWPELATVGYQDELDALLERARAVARQEGIYLAMGVGLLSADPAEDYISENRFVLLDPQGEVVLDFLKYGCTALNMYDFEIQTVDTPYGRLAGVICCDLDYPYVIRQVSQKGVDILLVPSFEPTAENITAHSQMAPFRAIENGVSIFRPTSQGISLAIDPYGRILGSMDATRVDERVFVVQLPNQRVLTVYSLVGDLFGWLVVVGFVVMLSWAIFRGRKAGVAATGSPEA